MDEITLAGLIVPLLTPFDARGEIDRPAFANHLGRLADAGLKRVLVGGTCGEFFSMVAAERLDLLKLALEYFPRLVLFQVGGGPLAEARELAAQAQSLGADGVLCLPPSFFADAPPDGLSAFLTAVAEVVDIPFMLYNFPRHTGNPLTATVLKQVDHFGIKDSAGDLSLAAVTPRYFSGNDACLVAAMARGAAGFFSGGANVYPADYVAIERAFEASDAGQAAERLATVLPRVAGRVADEIPRMKHLLHERFPDFPATVRPPLSARLAS